MSEKKIAIVQSNYIPWKGYFDMIASVDEFIIYDDMQYTKRDWRNRNKIKTPDGLKWLTVPVKVKGKYKQKINEVEIDGDDWVKLHWKSLENCYRRAPFYNEIYDLIRSTYTGKSHKYLSKLNCELISLICSYLGIKTIISNSSDYNLCEGKTEKLAHLCIQAGAKEYVSGAAAKNYLDDSVFMKQDIKIEWFDYSAYPEYEQLWGEFEHKVSILDLLFNCGKDSSKYMKYVMQS